jgi:hypothetical protein
LSAGPTPYLTNTPPPDVFVKYLADHGMQQFVTIMAHAGHPEARVYMNANT